MDNESEGCLQMVVAAMVVAMIIGLVYVVGLLLFR